MSILNAWVTPERALLATDSAVDEQPGVTVSKMFGVPLWPAVIGGRGLSFAAPMLVPAAAMVTDFGGLLDGAAGAIAQNARQIAQQFPGAAQNGGGQEIVIVGWSQAQGRVVGRLFSRDTMLSPVREEAIDPHHIAPWHDDLEGLPDPDTPERMAALVRAQAAVLHREKPGAAAGGTIVLAELTRDGVAFSHAGELGSA